MFFFTKTECKNTFLALTKLGAFALWVIEVLDVSINEQVETFETSSDLSSSYIFPQFDK